MERTNEPQTPSSATNANGNRIIQSTPQTFITVADKPLFLGGVVKKVPVSEFEKEMRCHFLEKIDASECALDNLTSANEFNVSNLNEENIREQFESILKCPRDDLVICKIDERVGYGVFASQEIPKGTVLCYYSGVLLRNHTSSKDDEAFDIANENMAYSTSRYHGLASFFQHLPSALRYNYTAEDRLRFLNSTGSRDSLSTVKLDDELYSVKFFRGVMGSLAKENVLPVQILYNRIPVTLFVTKESIPAGEQLGINYGSGYWLHRGIVPEFFDDLGNVISPSHYIRTFYQLKFENNVCYTGELQPLIQQLKLGKHEVVFTDDCQRIQKVSAATAAKELLRVRGITPEEFNKFLLETPSSFQSSSALFKTTEMNTLVNPDDLPDTTLVSKANPFNSTI